MRFKIDENLPVEVAELLRLAGHDTTTVLDQQLGGHHDTTVATVCQQEERALMTLDLDFADIRTYPPAQHPGFIVLRLQRQDKRHVLEVCTRLLPVLSQESLAQHLWIVEEDRIRIRA